MHSRALQQLSLYCFQEGFKEEGTFVKCVKMCVKAKIKALVAGNKKAAYDY